MAISTKQMVWGAALGLAAATLVVWGAMHFAIEKAAETDTIRDEQYQQNLKTEGLKYVKAVLSHFNRAEMACWGTNAPATGGTYMLLVKFPDVGLPEELTGWQLIKDGWTLHYLDNGTWLYAQTDEETFVSVTPDITNLPCGTRMDVGIP